MRIMYNFSKLQALFLFVMFSKSLVATDECPKFQNSKDNADQSCDLTVVGCTRFSNGIGRNAVAALDYLQDTLKINFIDTRPEFSSFEDLPPRVVSLLQKNDPAASGNVAILYEALKLPDGAKYIKVPNSKIKLAYSMVESTKIPNEWPSIINDHFDAVVVPDNCLVDIYKKCGVKKPIFVVAHPIYIDEFLSLPLKQSALKNLFLEHPQPFPIIRIAACLLMPLSKSLEISLASNLKSKPVKVPMNLWLLKYKRNFTN